MFGRTSLKLANEIMPNFEFYVNRSLVKVSQKFTQSIAKQV